jgi:TatD DNase family protein
VAGYARGKGARIRVITNGQGDLISGRHVAAELKGLVDRVSISLNAPLGSDYDAICAPVFGERAYSAILEFIKGCVAAGIDVEVTCLDFIGEGAVAEVKDIAEKAGASFRLRHLGAVG